MKSFFVESDRPIPSGKQQVRIEFAYDGRGLAKGGGVTLFIGGEQAGKGRVDATLPVVFSADDGCDVGCDNGAPVSSDYGPTGNAFNGTVKGVQLAFKEDADMADHKVTPEMALQVAMSRQ